jgi:cyclomaltodextrinase
MTLRTPFATLLLLLAAVPGLQGEPMPMKDHQYASEQDLARIPVMKAREADWRNGPIVYQVLVDRFAPPENLDAKRDLYPAPKRLRAWTETPTKGGFNEEVQVWSHEIDFWGGDLQEPAQRSSTTSTSSAPMCSTSTRSTSPTRTTSTTRRTTSRSAPSTARARTVKELAADAQHARHEAGPRRRVQPHGAHVAALSRRRSRIPRAPGATGTSSGPSTSSATARGTTSRTLPEVHLENPAVQARLYGDEDSVVQGYLRDGVDGWRLDVAFDIGPAVLAELTQGAHDRQARLARARRNLQLPRGVVARARRRVEHDRRQAALRLPQRAT